MIRVHEKNKSLAGKQGKAPGSRNRNQKIDYGPSAGQLAWRRFRRHKGAIVGISFITFFVLVAILAPILSPYEPTEQNRQLLLRECGGLPPGQFGAAHPCGPITEVPSDSRLVGHCIRPEVLIWECGLHPLGTDQLGRDILTRVMYGGRVSLIVGFVAALAATLLGAMLGGFAAFFGGRIDVLISRFIDIMLSIPTLPLLLITSGLLATSDAAFIKNMRAALGDSESIVIIILVIVLLSWMSTARLVRGEILSLRERDFIQAAHSMGFSKLRIIVRHLLPNTMHLIIVQATLWVGDAILTESGLSFLGFGIKEPTVSWGNMLAMAQDLIFQPNGIFVALFPGICIFLTVLCFNFLGDGLRDALDPRGRR
ncbi:ABC transporter permease [Candidatus Acetothermia bacterium]|nr:ABC transporter permease [Candidatus Acetothermia bacterium]MBI3643310.1 ABC transporter permease [Candidatus Acetothermia bacterium]